MGVFRLDLYETMGIVLEMSMAYGYVRWSTNDQDQGDSLDRQTRAITEFATRKGLFITEKDMMIDDGVSDGKNLAKGKLGRFIRRIIAKELPACPLFIEDLDRFTRSQETDALFAMSDLIRAGVTVHVVRGEKVFNGKPGAMEWTGLLWQAKTNAEYLQRCKGHGVNTWNRIGKVNPGEAMYSQLPAWLTAPKREWRGPAQKMRVIADRARLIKRIYKMALEGNGSRKIAATLDREKIATWSGVRTWSPDYINKLLADRRLLGEHQRTTLDEKGNRTDAELLVSYYPKVIEPGLFARVQTARAAIWKAHCGKSGNGKARKESPNLFAGLLVDCKTGCSYTLRLDTKVTKDGKRKSYPKLICKLPGGKYHIIHFVEFRDNLLSVLMSENWESIFSVQASEDLTSQIESAKAELDSAGAQRKLLLAARSDKSLTESERAMVVGDYLASVKRETAAAAELETLQSRLSSFDAACPLSIQAPSLAELKARIAELVKLIEVEPGTKLYELSNETVPGYWVKIHYRSDVIHEAFVERS